MSFIHIADLHLGAWKEEKIERLSINAFKKFISESIKIKPEFILIAGDLFHTPLPRIELMKIVVESFRQLNENNIPIFYIAGSHDYSPTGKTILSVLESAKLCKKVENYNINKTSGNIELNGITFKDYYITGISGKGGMSDINQYKKIIINPSPNKKNIFTFHTSIAEFFPYGGINVDDLPQGFDYYAGGHIHVNKIFEHNNKKIIYPGTLFPDSFDELWNNLNGYYIVDLDTQSYTHKNIMENKIIKIDLNGEFDSKTLHNQLLSQISNKNINNKIILIKIKGTLKKGNYLNDIKFKEIIDYAYENGAYFVMRNTNNLQREEFEKIAIEKKPETEIVNEIINQNLKDIPFNMTDSKKTEFLKNLMQQLSITKIEGETNDQYDSRLLENINQIINKFLDI